VAQLVDRADKLREAGQRSEAIAAYAKAHDADATRVYPLYWLSTLYEEGGELARALACCRRAIELDPDQIGLWLRFAHISAAMFDDATALECYERVVALDPNLPSIDAHLADCHCRLGRLREGVAAFDRALARTPDDVTLQNNRLFVL